MSWDGSVELPFGDNIYRFRLGWGELIKLEESRDAGCLLILDRLHNGQWRAPDIREVLRIGLIGGGLDPLVALGKVRQYVESAPLLTSLMIAQRVMMEAMIDSSASQDDLKKSLEKAMSSASTPDPTDEPGLPFSTGLVQ